MFTTSPDFSGFLLIQKHLYNYLHIKGLVFFILEVSAGGNVEKQVAEPSVNKILTELNPGLYTHLILVKLSCIMEPYCLWLI